MKAITAHVRNGQIVPDEPMSLLDGTMVEIIVREQEGTDGRGTPAASDAEWQRGPIDDLDAAELEELDAALDESRAQIERGEYEDARTVVLRLAARM